MVMLLPAHIFTPGIYHSNIMAKPATQIATGDEGGHTEQYVDSEASWGPYTNRD